MQCVYIVICDTVRLIVGKVTLRDTQFYRIRRMMIDDSTVKNTRLLDTVIENSFLRLNTWICNFWSSKYVILTNLTTLLSLLLILILPSTPVGPIFRDCTSSINQNYSIVSGNGISSDKQLQP